LFIDSDVILDVSIERSVDITDSRKILCLVEDNIVKGFTSSLVFANLYYIKRKLIGHDKAINYLKDLKILLNIINVSSSAVENALNSTFNDFEDAIQYFSALENDIDYIITRNVKDYIKLQIPILTPTEFCKNN